MTNFVRFLEHNDNEGETWTFWVQITGNERALADLADLVAEEEEYELDPYVDQLAEAEVNLLVEYGGGGYMSYHNKVTGRLVLPDDFDPDDLYKGGVRDLFKSDS